MKRKCIWCNKPLTPFEIEDCLDCEKWLKKKGIKTAIKIAELENNRWLIFNKVFGNEQK